MSTQTGIFAALDRKIPKLRWYDISGIKTASMLFGFLVAKYFPVVLSFGWGWYVALMLLVSAPALYHYWLMPDV